MSMAWWVWMTLGIALFIAEVVTPSSFYLMFLGLGAFSVGVLAAVGVLDAGAWQWFFFAAFSVAFVVFLRSRFAFLKASPGDMDADKLVGEFAVLLDEVLPGSEGKAEMRGSVWKVRNGGVRAIAKGERTKVNGIDRLTLLIGDE